MFFIEILYIWSRTYYWFQKMKIELQQVTLICLTNQKFEDHKKMIDDSCKNINFGAVKIIWDEKCNSIEKWNEKIIYDLPKYIDTSHALLMHADSQIIHPELWDNEWLKYDWCSSPWPLPTDSYSYRSESGKIQRVGNSVGLRSKKLMDLIATKPEKEFWAIKEKYGNCNEDGWICCHNREWLESQGCTFMPFEEALHFGREHILPENKYIKTFLFHSII